MVSGIQDNDFGTFITGTNVSTSTVVFHIILPVMKT